MKFKALIAFECSGLIRDEFISLGWDAVSCDLKPTERPGPHIQGDVRKELKNGYDLMVAHPVCKFLTKAGEQWMFHPEDSKLERHKRRRNPRYPNRLQDQIDAIELFEECQNAPIPLRCIENPRPMEEVAEMVGKPTQVVQPWWFGDPYTKTTCLWLYGLPKLQPEYVVGRGDFHRTPSGRIISKWYSDAKTSNKEKTSTDRSRTFPGMARAIARQFDFFVRNKKVFGELF